MTVKIQRPKIECHEIGSNLSKDRAMHEEDNLSFQNEFILFNFLLTVKIHICIFKQVAKYCRDPRGLLPYSYDDNLLTHIYVFKFTYK
jgi:hypothetical protein